MEPAKRWSILTLRSYSVLVLRTRSRLVRRAVTMPCPSCTRPYRVWVQALASGTAGRACDLATERHLCWGNGRDGVLRPLVQLEPDVSGVLTVRNGGDLTHLSDVSEAKFIPRHYIIFSQVPNFTYLNLREQLKNCLWNFHCCGVRKP